ncbi:MAG: hypothetical protein CL477_05930 [Acidobacteria bacterium]|nr:hypothetical protein [Acidobacteriota bacterium]
MTDFEGLIRRLGSAEVRYVLIGDSPAPSSARRGPRSTWISSTRVTKESHPPGWCPGISLTKNARRTGRPRGLAALAELEALLEEQRRKP